MNRGQEVDAPLHCTSEENAQSAIDLFRIASEADPHFLIDKTLAAKDSCMATLSVAMLFSCASDIMLKLDGNKNKIYAILVDKCPAELLDCVEYLKGKTLGRGLGSRSQKTIRRVMESWHPKILEEYIVVQPKEVYALIKIIHPRYKGQRGALTKALISGRLK